MSPTGSPPGDAAYIRGGGGVEVDARLVVRVVAALGILALVGTAVALTVSAASANSRIDRLRHRGVPVTAVVSGCLAIGSGIGMGIEYWQCRADYTLSGHRYNEVIGGSRTLLDRGQTVQAVAVPGEAASLSTTAFVAKKRSAWTRYMVPIVLGAVAATVTLGLLVWSRRSGREGRPGLVPECP